MMGPAQPPRLPDSDGPEIKMDLEIKIHQIEARKETPFLKTDPTSSWADCNLAANHYWCKEKEKSNPTKEKSKPTKEKYNPTKLLTDGRVHLQWLNKKVTFEVWDAIEKMQQEMMPRCDAAMLSRVLYIQPRWESGATHFLRRKKKQNENIVYDE